MTRKMAIHAFVSAKGGVGKSTLATSCALLNHAKGRHVAVFDLDLTGSSLGDGLPLQAPDLSCGTSGELDLRTNAPGLLLSRQETERRWRERRAAGSDARWLPYLNDCFRFVGEDAN